MANKADQEATDTASDSDFEAVPHQNTPADSGIPKVPGLEQGRRMMREELSNYTSTSPKLSGGDVDAAWEQADAVGEEAVGGTVATPDQNVVDELGAAVGLEMDDRAFLRTTEILEERDDSRWELDPTSSEDYSERRE
ncbi:DUF6335 family protein [Microcoleus sp. FACHB-672]|uniref:DUF6335 family protein n=1 Tax=Microcoleus sp. FACHB-672 TaxID=2692825 RepID=UPI001688C5A2|nr:DUF6335 family protein [Microcoleus sp. FACHB-672]MBD2042908.1 hypothetical protein [Microcoleus sp. FACHB-672]